MPKGGFGNLIALPLQHGPRQEGNSVFVDDRFVAFPGDKQWEHLASVPRIDPATVETTSREAARQGRVIGVRLADSGDDEENAAPWTRLPSGKPRSSHTTQAFPKAVRTVLAQRLHVEKAGLPSPLLNQIKRLAAFQNPEFYKKQRMRLWTGATPRVIACAEELPQHIALPRGCHADLEELLSQHGVTLEVDDQRCGGEPAKYRFRGQLTRSRIKRCVLFSQPIPASSLPRLVWARPSSAPTSSRRAPAARSSWCTGALCSTNG